MKRLAFIGSWQRLGIQAGLLAGLGLAFVGGSQTPAVAGGECPTEAQCTFKKPNFLIVMDYSSSMNADFVVGQTRWEAAVEAVQNIVTTNNGYFDERMHIALMRYGHDPNPEAAGTSIQGDMSGLVDGQSLDVHWYDPNANPTGYFECNGQEVVDFLDQVEPPLCIGINCAGIGTWTQGALQFARDVVSGTRGDHPDDVIPGEERFYAVLLMTDGVYTCADGECQGNDDPFDDINVANPAPTAGNLFANDDVPVYVVAFGDAVGENFADDIAFAGGTTSAIEAGAGQLVGALEDVVDDIQNSVIIPECTGGLPRMMVILDASSSMLNVGNPFDAPNYSAGAMGQTGWDQARDALAGVNSLFDAPVAGQMNQPVEDLIHLSLVTFGSPGEQELLVPYGPCMKDNFEWALDPNTSCGAGCPNPWNGPPIIWTPQGPGAPTYPGFDADTFSIMPSCDPGQFDPDACTGSGTAIHTGLELADATIADYRANPPALYPVNPDTTFANILITDGQYNIGGWSTDEQVSGALTDLFANDGITTYVIGFGDQISTTELNNMACWGSGGTGIPCENGTVAAFDAGNQVELASALETIIEQINFDPCCNFNDCSFNPEPTTGEADPVPTDTSSSGSDSADTTDGLTSGPGTTDGTGDSGQVDESGSDSNASATMGSVTATSANTTTVGSDDGGETDTDTDTAGGASDDSGCGCRTDGNGGRGWLGTLFALILLGGARRRRRG